jgi:hypothetical protein
MHVVAITGATAGAAADAEALARALGEGITALEVRMALSAVHPSILFRTPSRDRAHEAASLLVARGLPVVAVDLADVVSIDAMVHVHRFAIDATGLHADARGPTLAYDAIGAIVRVSVESSIWRTTRELENEMPGVHGRQIQVKVERTRADHAIEQALFLFVRGGGVPWVLRAGEARYLALGAGLRPTSMENFLATVTLLRDRAPRAVYDERFVARPLVRQAETHVRGHDTAAPELGDLGVEVRLHLLARALTHASGGIGPYR